MPQQDGQGPQYATPERAEAAHKAALYKATIEQVRGNRDLTSAARNRRNRELH